MKLKSLSLNLLTAGLLSATFANSAFALEQLKNRSIEKPTSRIVGGQEATPFTYPFMSSLQANGNHFCGASYIGDGFALTAAHCVPNENSEGLSVVIGGHSLSNEEQGQRIAVTQVFTHELYGSDFTMSNDIAVLKLASDPVDIEPIELVTPDIFAQLQSGSEFKVMGWGALNEGADGPDSLHEVNVPMIDSELCNSAEYYNGEITDTMICAGFEQGGQDSCQGDSGGPLIYQHEGKWYQTGIVSWGWGCAAEKRPGVYSHVLKLTEWLNSKKSGIGFTSIGQLGYVEHPISSTLKAQLSNLSEQEVQITSVQHTSDTATISDENCSGLVLASAASCHTDLDLSQSNPGFNQFILSASVERDDFSSVMHKVNFTSLPESEIDVTELVGGHDLINWYSGGDATWGIEDGYTSDGESAISSGSISDRNRSALLASVLTDRAQSLSFDYLISSETGYDGMVVYHNNEIAMVATGLEPGFQSFTLDLSAQSENRIAFVYIKDQMESAGMDKAIIDNVKLEITNTAPVIQFADYEVKVRSEKNFTLDASPTSDAENDSLTYQWRELTGGLVTIADPTQSVITLTAPKVDTTTRFAFEVTVTDQYGASSTKQVFATVKKPKSSSGLFGALGLLSLLAFRRFKKA